MMTTIVMIYIDNVRMIINVEVVVMVVVVVILADTGILGP